MSFKVNNNLFINFLLTIIALGLVISSGSLFRYVYSYNLIMFITIAMIAIVVFYQFFIPTDDHIDKTDNKTNSINISGLILILFFIFIPTLSDVYNQVLSYEITYFHIIMLLLSFLIGADTRKTILSYYLRIIVILSFISLLYFFTELLFGLPSFIPYYGIPETKLSHFYYIWSKPIHQFILIRNQSIFFEPGVFGFHLIVSTLLAYKEKNRIFITILIIACLTSMSTTVYIFLSLLVVYQLLWGKNKLLFIGIMSISFIIILGIIKVIFGSLDMLVYLVKIITDKFFINSQSYASMQERTHFFVESMKLFFDNIILGAGHYAADIELKNVGSETSALSGLLAELGLFGAVCIFLYVRFFKHFKLLSLPIALIWLNGEFMQYTSISLFILTHMVDEISIQLFPISKLDRDIPSRYSKHITNYSQ